MLYKLNLEGREEKLRNSNIPEKNKEAILRFCRYLRANGYSEHRVLKYLSKLRIISEILGKEFEKATREDIERVLAEIDSRG